MIRLGFIFTFSSLFSSSCLHFNLVSSLLANLYLKLVVLSGSGVPPGAVSSYLYTMIGREGIHKSIYYTMFRVCDGLDVHDRLTCAPVYIVFIYHVWLRERAEFSYLIKHLEMNLIKDV